MTAIILLLAALAAPDMAEGADDLAQRCESEVVELHRFLEEWSNATLPETEAAFERFGGVIAPSFVIIDPDGVTLGRQPIVDAIRRAHGRWVDTPGVIRIENFRLHQAGGGLALATYEEWHDLPGETVGRLSSVLFGPNEEAPNGLEWLHLHEVWLPRPEDVDGDSG
jgi:hypothetical protein